MYHVSVNRKIICSVVLLLLLSAALTVQAATREGTYGAERMSRDEPMTKQTGKMMSGRIGFLQHANKLIGTDVRNSGNEMIGSVSDLIIDNNQRTIYYVILSAENKLYPVPWEAFDATGQTCMLNIAKSNLMQAPRIDMIDLPTLSNLDYRQKVESFYSEQISAVQGKGTAEEAVEWMKEKMQQTFGAGEKLDLCRFSQLKGLEVQNPQGEKLAKLDDVLIDVRHGTIAYGMVSFGGVMGVAAKTAVVPYSALGVQPQTGIARLDADKTTLESAVLKEDQMQQLTEPQFARQIHEKFGTQPYWEVFGFVPGEEMKMSMAAWQADSKYNRSFDPAKMTTIEGTITSVDTFQPEKGAALGLLLKVETKEGESVTVHAGPSHYVAQQDIRFNAGEPVIIKGSRTRIALKSVIMATEIQTGGKTLRLRDEKGAPQWKVEKMEK